MSRITIMLNEDILESVIEFECLLIHLDHHEAGHW